MDILYMDKNIIVCIKPARVLSTDEPGGLPELIRQELGDEKADVRTVHRLDRVVSGLMVLARNHAAASELSRQIREGSFKKIYYAAVHGETPDRGTMKDLMYRDKARKMSFTTDIPSKDTREAVLNYETIARADGMSLVRVELVTGRTHQIRCQFASRSYPLLGERKYSELNDSCELALWSENIGFVHPESHEYTEFSQLPPDEYPWSCFKLTNG